MKNFFDTIQFKTNIIICVCMGVYGICICVCVCVLHIDTRVLSQTAFIDHGRSEMGVSLWKVETDA